MLGWPPAKIKIHRRHGLTSRPSSSAWCSSAFLHVLIAPAFLRYARQWGSAAKQESVLPLPSPVPWLVLPDGSAISFPHGQTFHLPEGTCYYNSYGEWVLLSREDKTCFLMNPFTKATVMIPNLSSCSPYFDPVETVNDRVVPKNEMLGTWMDYIESDDILVVTLIVCSTCLVAAIVAVDEYGFAPGKLYAIDAYTEDLLVIDIVDGHGKGINEFEVLKLDFGCSLWVEMRCLGADLALFLGRGCSRAVCVSPHDLSRDCIFFVDDYTDDYHWKKITTSCGVYDMNDGKIYSPLPTVSWKSATVPATWLFSQANMDK
ncbi:hypothetical protein QOZ80_9BG0696260 [Eleusine coracana subsp. coracana]|nr:hypothetical protein QOZ80_9BG0696260 [Eleusine coracana subsp. coracana]